MKPRWLKIEKENPWLKTEYLDFDEDEEKVKKFNIQSEKLPVFIFFNKNGKEILRLAGEKSEEELTKIILEHKNK